MNEIEHNHHIRDVQEHDIESSITKNLFGNMLHKD